jgi:hypothetical protein
MDDLEHTARPGTVPERTEPSQTEMRDTADGKDGRNGKNGRVGRRESSFITILDSFVTMLVL